MSAVSNYELGNSSPSGRFCARVPVVLYNKLAQITKRPDGNLNYYRTGMGKQTKFGEFIMKRQHWMHKILSASVLVSLLLLAVGCSKETAPGPISPIKPSHQPSLAKRNTGNNTVTQITPIPRRTRSVNGFGGTASKYMTVSSGGKLEYMGHKMNVPSGALSQNTEMYITDVNSELIQANYGPSGWFNKPVTITISYADADLREVDLKKMTIAWYDEAAGTWVDVGGVVDRVNQTITVAVWHFTQYTISTR
jgi:hypothetical protein